MHAQDLGQYFNESDLTLQFLPGNHTCNVNLTIASIHQLEILGNSSAMMPTKVVCDSHVGFTFKDISEVRIDGIAIVACARSRVAQASNSDDYKFPTYYGLHLGKQLRSLTAPSGIVLVVHLE